MSHNNGTTKKTLEQRRQKLRQQSDERLKAVKQTGQLPIDAYATDEHLQRVIQTTDPINQHHLKIIMFAALATQTVTLAEARSVVDEWKYSVNAARQGLIEDIDDDELMRWESHLRFAEAFYELLKVSIGVSG